MNKEILQNMTYGMYAIGVKDSDKASATIINSVTRISSDHVAIMINKSSYSAYCMKKSGIFTVSILSKDTPCSAIGALGLVCGKKTDKLKNIRHKILIEGVPVIKENTCCWILCDVTKVTEFENQSFIIGKIIAGSDESTGEPMTYEYYTKVLKGTVAIDSPVFIKPDRSFDKSSGEGFVCSVCGYHYNDPDFSFEELRSNWVCPICKMPKAAFIRK